MSLCTSSYRVSVQNRPSASSAGTPSGQPPLLWRSEFRNVLAVYMRRGLLALDHALQLIDNAELLMRGREYEISSARIFSLVAGTRCSAYDGEFVALA
jgi:hypothetical protein